MSSYTIDHKYRSRYVSTKTVGELKANLPSHIQRGINVKYTTRKRCITNMNTSVHLYTASNI